MIRRILPYPVISVFLLLIWIALGRSYSPGWIVLGLVFSTVGSWLMAALRLDEPTLRRPKAALQLLVVVSIDIVRSNIAVARIISRPNRPVTSGFLVIHLDITSPTALAILSVILTATPGTIWVSYDREEGSLLLHILDLVDEESWVRLIKGRYERMLTAVFE